MKKHNLIVFSSEDQTWAERLKNHSNDTFSFMFFNSSDEAKSEIQKHSYGLAAIVCNEKDTLKILEKTTIDYYGEEVADVPLVVVGTPVDNASVISQHVSNFSTPADPSQLLDFLNQVLAERIDLLEERAFIAKIFIEEAEELIEQLKSVTERMPVEVDNPEISIKIHRIAHTIKGSSAISNEMLISEYAKSFEKMMAVFVRETKAPDEPARAKILAATKRLSTLVSERKAGLPFHASIETLVKDFT